MVAIANLVSVPATTLNDRVLLSMLLAVALIVTGPATLPVKIFVATPAAAVAFPRPVTLPLPVVWLNVTVPAKVVVLPDASFTVAVKVRLVLEFRSVVTPVSTTCAGAPGFTVKEALAPVFPLPVAVIVVEPMLVIVTLCGSNTPAVNVPDVTGAPASAPLDVNVTGPVKVVTVLLLTSCAVTRMLNAVAAVCVAIVPPPVFSTRK